MKRRYFLAIGAAVVATLKAPKSGAAEPTVTEKDILKEGQSAAVANYCESPDKQPNKFCPTKPAGKCIDCTFFNKPESKAKFKGKDVAKCQLLAAAPSYVYATASCSTFVKKP